MGAAYLIDYKLVQNNLAPSKTQGNLTLKQGIIKTYIFSKNKLVSDNHDIDPDFLKIKNFYLI